MPARFATATEALSWTEQFARVERGDYDLRRHRLQRMRSMLSLLGNPQLRFDAIHITGSKGKGSTASYLAHILRESGRVVGLYSSPHLEDYRERIRVLGSIDPDATIRDQMSRVADAIEAVEFDPHEVPSTFELLTACAYSVFAALEVDLAIIEVGIGGRQDATNVITPLASVITTIELEHTGLLGTTLRSIAAEKSGIIKRGRPVFTGEIEPEADAVIRRIAELRAAPVYSLSEMMRTQRSELTDGGTRVEAEFEDGAAYRATLSAYSEVQAKSATLAIAVAKGVYPRIEPDTMSAGIQSATIPGRSELLDGSPKILLDAAHTPVSIARLAGTVSFLEHDRDRRVIIFAAVAGKPHAAMIKAVKQFGVRVVLTRAGEFKPSDPERLANIARERRLQTKVVPDLSQALDAAQEWIGSKGLIVITGSFYLVGGARRLLRARGRIDDGNGTYAGRQAQGNSR